MTTTSISSRGRFFRWITVVAIVIGSLVSMQQPVHAADLAFVEFYDPNEADEVEFAALLALGKGHNQALSNWRLRLDYGSIQPLPDWALGSSEGFAVRLRNGRLTGFRLEHMISVSLGVELGALKTHGLTANLGSGNVGTLADAELKGFNPYSVGLNLHLTPDRPLDFYIGVQVANADHGNLSMTVTENGSTTTTPISSGLGWGLHAGVDVPIGERGWLFQAGLRYLHFRFEVKTDSPQQHTFEAYLLHLGLGYRF